jgi:hypothetical protein
MFSLAQISMQPIETTIIPTAIRTTNQHVATSTAIHMINPEATTSTGILTTDQQASTSSTTSSGMY